jgi:hypothetical protein
VRRSIACLGPAAGPCFLDERGSCPLAAGATVLVVDAPVGGSFKCHLYDMPAGEYTERLQRAHPQCYVLLVAGRGWVGPTGEVAVANDRDDALQLLTSVLRAPTIERAAQGGGLKVSVSMGREIEGGR